jgi:hypothetical protein
VKLGKAKVFLRFTLRGRGDTTLYISDPPVFAFKPFKLSQAVRNTMAGPGLLDWGWPL